MSRTRDLERLTQRLSSVQETDERRWGVMTAAQMVCHVRGAFKMAMGEIHCAPIAMPMPKIVLKQLALWVPIRWQQGLPTVPALEIEAPTMRSNAFEQDRDEALAAMQEFARPAQTRTDHAFFGRMSYTDWMRWGYLHTDHHLRQFGR